MVLFILNYRKCKLIYNDRKRVVGYLWIGQGGESEYYKRTLGSEDMFIILSDGFTGVYLCQNLPDYKL